MATPAKLHKDITAGKFKPAYYFFGSEDYRITEAQKFVARQFLPDRQMVTNFRRLDGRRVRPEDIVMELSTLPMLGEKQVFVVDEFQSFKPKEVKRVLEALTPPVPSRIVIFTSPSPRSPRKNTAFFKSVANAAEVVEFNRLSVEESARVIRQRLKKQNLTIDRAALQHLLELISGSRGGLEAELEKLVNYKQSGEQITLADIKKIAGGYEVFNIFAVADLIVAGHTRQVINTIAHLIAEGSSPVTIVTLLQQHFISLFLVKNDRPPLGKRGFLTNKFREQARKFTNEQLEQAVIEIAGTDSDLRRAAIRGQTQVEMLALKLVESVKSRND